MSVRSDVVDRLSGIQLFRTVQRYTEVVWGIVLILVAWETAVRVNDINRVILPAPLDVVQVMLENQEMLIYHTGVTLYEVALGFFFGTLLGFVSGVGIFYVPYLRRALYPLLTTISLVPKISFAPLLLIWFGVGTTSKTILALLTVYFPVLVNTYTGLTEIDDEMLELSRSFRVSEWFLFRHVRLPNALPFISTSIKLGVSYAVIGAVVAEFVGSTKGLGYLVITTSARAQTPITMAAIFMTILIGLVLYWIAAYFDRRLLHWYVEE